MRKSVFLLGFLFIPQCIFADSALQEQLRLDMKILTSKALNGRKTGTPEGTIAANYILERFKGVNSTAYLVSFSSSCFYKILAPEIRGENIVAHFPSVIGSSQTIIVGAHFDGVGYPAANDNASGTAALLVLAELIQKRNWNHNFLFIAFGAEEPGLCGSLHFTKNNSTTAFSYMLNMDMVGQSLRNEGRPLYVLGDDENQLLRNAFLQTKEFSELKIIFGNEVQLGYEWASDHSRFHDAGIPSVMLIGGNGADHHLPTDTEEKIEYDYLESVVYFLYLALIELDKQ